MKKILFLLLLLCLNFASSSDIAEIISQSTGSYIIILIVFIMSALVYMAGSIFSSPNWTARGKDMLYQGIFSLVIMASFPAIYALATSLFSTLFLGEIIIPGNVSMYEVSENLLIWNYIYFFIHLIVITAANMFVLTFFGRTYNVAMASRVVPFDMTVLQSPLLFIINVLVGILSTSIMINGFQLLFLNFVRTALLPFLLPIGLLLRAFPTSMHAGNVLVGISLAAFIIVPIVYAIDLQILPEIMEVPDNIDDNSIDSFKAYDSFALMSAFYNAKVLQDVVVESASCDLIKESKKYMGYGVVGEEDLSELQEASENCDINFFDTFGAFFSKVDTTSQYIGGGFIGAATLTKGINGVVGTINALLKTKIGLPVWFKVINAVAIAGASIYIIIFFYEILLGVAISFVILSAILPFIKFTIIILFIREFTYTILGTQVSLGQITRLL